MSRAIRNAPAAAGRTRRIPWRVRPGLRPAAGPVPGSLIAFFAPGRVRLAAPVFALLICGVFLLARHGRNGAAGIQDGEGNTHVSPAGTGRGYPPERAPNPAWPSSARRGPAASCCLPGARRGPGIPCRCSTTAAGPYTGSSSPWTAPGPSPCTIRKPKAPLRPCKSGTCFPCPTPSAWTRPRGYERFYLVTAPRPFGSEGLVLLRGRFSRSAISRRRHVSGRYLARPGRGFPPVPVYHLQSGIRAAQIPQGVRPMNPFARSVLSAPAR